MGKRSYVGSILSAQFFYKPDTKKYVYVCAYICIYVYVWILSQVYLLHIKIKLNNILLSLPLL